MPHDDWIAVGGLRRTDHYARGMVARCHSGGWACHHVALDAREARDSAQPHNADGAEGRTAMSITVIIIGIVIGIILTALAIIGICLTVAAGEFDRRDKE